MTGSTAQGTDVLIVGGGIAGGSLGYELTGIPGGPAVVVLEAETEPGRHATGRSAATFLESYGPAPVRRLTGASRQFFTDPPDGFPRPLVRRRPYLLVAPATDVGRLAAIAREVATRSTVRLLDPGEARRWCPALRADWVAAAMLEPDAADVDVAGLHQGYLAGLRRRGGRLVTGAAVTRMRRRGERWEVETAGSGRFSASLVVDAAGAWADRVAGSAGVPRLGLQPFARNVFLVPPPAQYRYRNWPLVADLAETFYLKPEGAGLLCSAADEVPLPPADVRPDSTRIARAIETINEATTLEVRHVRTAWAGLRTFAPDRIPVAGPDPAAPGFGWLAGQGGYGIQAAPALARFAAAALTGSGYQPEDVAVLAPARLRG